MYPLGDCFCILNAKCKSKFALQDFQGMSKCAVNKVVNILPCEREVSGPHNPNHLGKFAVLFSVYPSKSNGDLHVIVYAVHSEAVWLRKKHWESKILNL